MIARLFALVIALFGLGVLFSASASAHASMVGSDPANGARLQAAPTSVTITFNEDVGLGAVGYLHVTDQAGARADAGTAFHPDGNGRLVTERLRAGLGDGTYTASFRVVSADAHPLAGTLRFVVGDGPEAPTSADAGPTTNDLTGFFFGTSRWLSFAGLALLGGSWLLLAVWPAGRGERRARRLVWAGWTATFVGGASELLLQGPYSAGIRPNVFDLSLLADTLQTSYGQLHSTRLLLLGALALLLARSLQASDRARWELVFAPIAIWLLWTFSATGHAATTSPSWLSVPIDVLHLLAMAVWLGGLALVLGALLPRRDPDELRTVLPVFSTVALVSVLVLTATGTYSAFRGVGSLDALFGTTYGLLVVGKVVFLGAIVLAANVSRRVVHRRAVAYALVDTFVVDEEAEFADDPARVKRLRRSVLIETVIAFVVLVLSAVLVASPRGEEALAASYREPVSASASLGGHRTVTVTTDSGTHGALRFSVQLSKGPAPQAIAASAVQRQAQLGPLPITLTATTAGGYDGTATLPVPGTWQINLVITTSTFDATTASVQLPLH